MSIIHDQQVILSRLVYFYDPRMNKRWPFADVVSYKCLHKLLDELEFLLKMWHRRTLHHFCGHLDYCHKEELISETSDDFGLLSDFDYAVSTGMLSNHPVSDLSHLSQDSFNLTKEVFLMSTRLFYQLFCSEKEFLSTLFIVKKIKTWTFDILFHFYLSAIPEEVRIQLPVELWEKIYRMSLNSCEMKEEYSDFKNVRAVGAKSEVVLIEKHKMYDLFAAAGNLHMIIFDILLGIIFSPPKTQKNVILKPQHKGRFRVNHCFFHELKQNFCIKATRLMLLDNTSSFPDRKTCTLKYEESTSILNKIRMGVWYDETVYCSGITEHLDQHEEEGSFQQSLDDESLILIIPTKDTSRRQLKYLVWDCNRRALVDVVSLSLHQSDLYPAVESLGSHSLVILMALVKPNTANVLGWKLFTWKLTFEASLLTNQDAKVTELKLDSPFLNIVSLTTSLSNGYLIRSYSENQTHLVLVNPVTGCTIRSQSFKQLNDLNLRGDLALLGSDGYHVVDSNILFDLATFQVIEEFRTDDLCISGSCVTCQNEPDATCIYSSRFDCNKSSKIMIVFSANLSYYQVMKFDELEDDKPVPMFKGHFDSYQMPFNLRTSIFIDNLFLVHSVGFDERNCAPVYLCAVSLTSKAIYPIFHRFRRPARYPVIPYFIEPRLNAAHHMATLEYKSQHSCSCIMLSDGRLICQGSSFSYYELHLNLTLQQCVDTEVDFWSQPLEPSDSPHFDRCSSSD